jgi:hypothetical protein
MGTRVRIFPVVNSPMRAVNVGTGRVDTVMG